MKKIFLFALLVVILGSLLYSNTFRVPFTFDDYHSIVLNTKIHSLKDIPAIWSFTRTRFLTYLTFALNYHFGGLKVPGYHLVNLLIHLAATLSFFSFLRLLYRRVSNQEEPGIYLATLIFLVHPIQTQAVTYIVQRAASLATFFYLLTLSFFLQYRRASTRKYWWYAGALASAMAGMFTKEICWTLPLMLVFIDTQLAGSGENKISGNKRLLEYLPFLLTLTIIPSLVAFGFKVDTPGELARLAEPSGTISPVDYLLTEFRVLVTYLRLLIYPLGQNLDYDYPVYRSFAEPAVWASFLLLVWVAGIGVYSFRQGQKLLGLAVFWFFLTLSVESSIWPIRDVIFEHRLYLAMPAYGLAVGCLFFFLRKRSRQFLWYAAAVFLIGSYSFLTYSRNQVWKSAVTLWQDVAAKSPRKARAHHNLGHALTGEGHLDEAKREFDTALKLDPSFHLTYFTRGLLYLRQEQYQAAIRDFNILLSATTDKTRLSHVYLSRGQAYAKLGDYQKAFRDLNEAIRIDPKNAVAFSERGVLYAKQKEYERALRDMDEALKLNARSPEVHNNRGLLKVLQGQIEAALLDFRQALAEAPDFANVYVNMGLAYYRRSDWKQAIKAYRKALELNRNLVSAQVGLAFVYQAQGNRETAREQLLSALKEKPDEPELLKAWESLRKYDEKMIFAKRRSESLAYCEKGNSLREKGDLQAAIKQFTLALEKDRTLALAYYNRGRTYQELGRFEEALDDYTQAIKYNPKESEAWNNRGFLLDKQGKTEEAIRDYSQAVLVDPQNSQAYNNRGNAYFKKGEYEKAIADYTAALKLNPSLVQAYRNRGMAYARAKEYEKAAVDFQKYLELNPDDPKKEALRRFVEKHL
ncbi:MAG: tetratricopeptide repeat protein [Candidatus Omnitrophica bacterium]|nr:tetratricopeptide repeat protein [Candidatus Omnitrophota bacterium]